MTINEKSYAYGAQKSSIREIAAYGSARKAQIGAENVFDFSLGNPSIPAPESVRSSIARAGAAAHAAARLHAGPRPARRSRGRGREPQPPLWHQLRRR